MSMAASKKGPLDSSSLVSSEAMKLVTLCGTDKTDDEVHDIDDDNIIRHLTDEEDTDCTNQEKVYDDEYLESHLIPCNTVCSETVCCFYRMLLSTMLCLNTDLIVVLCLTWT